jgi:hypothetical protein
MLGTFQDWLAKPFSADMNAWHWFLFFGLIVVISVAWGMILRHIA